LIYAQQPEVDSKVVQESRTTEKHIVLVGVAGVGKTTVGTVAAEQLGFPFIDGDIEFEKVKESDIDTLLERYGEKEYDQRLLAFFAERLDRGSQAILAAPARLTHYKRFWSVVKSHAISIHLRGKPMEIYLRQDTWVKGRRLTKGEKLTDSRKAEYYDYYNWRLRHCQKADHTIRIVGNRDVDADTLCGEIRRLLSSHSSHDAGSFVVM